MKRKILGVCLTLVLACSLSLVSALPVAAATDWYVDCDATGADDGTSWEDAFDTIGEGITAAAASGDTVIVADGTYIEDFTIDKSLTLSGPNAAISPNTGTRDPEAIIDGAISVNTAADNITIQGFHFDVTPGTASINCPGGFDGDNLRILKNSFTAAPATGSGFEAIGVHSNTAIAGLVIDDNLVTGVRGIFVNPQVAGSDVTITNNVIDGDVATPAFAGISVDGVSGVISGNVISDMDDAGINVGSVAGPCDGLTIVNNNVTNAGVCDCANAGAINLYSDCTNITITGNTLADSYDGITIKNTGALGSGIAINNNNITGNSNYGVLNDAPAGTLDATNNWWGDASGPYIMSGVDSADNVRGFVDFWNWLDAPYATGEPTDNPGLVVGQSYNLYMKHLGLANTDVYLDDIGNDALAPADLNSVTDTDTYGASNDAALVTLGGDGKAAFTEVSPLYATYTETAQYIGIGDLDGDPFLHWLEVVPGDISDTTNVAVSPTSLTYGTAAEVTVTVTNVADGSPVVGAPVTLYLDDEGDGATDGDFLSSSSTGPNGEATFAFTPYAAGLLVAEVTADIGGRLGAPELTDGIADGSIEESVHINPIAITVTTEPTRLFVDFATDVTVTGTSGTITEPGLTVTLKGCVVDTSDTMNISDGTGTKVFPGVEAGSVGEIAVTVSKDTAGSSLVNEFLGEASITAEQAATLNVSLSLEEWVIADWTHAGDNLDVTIQGSNAEGPDGLVGGIVLDYVDIVVSGPNVSYSLAKAYWTGTAWALLDGGLPDGVNGQDSDTIRFEIAPNMANDVTVEVTGYTTAIFTPVGPAVTEMVTVLGYALYNYPTEDIELDTAASLSLDVKTKAGQLVNVATVTIAAAADTFGKDFDGSGVIEAGEKFAEITIGENRIAYGATGETDVYYVNNGHYEVTDITFLALGPVSIDVRDDVGAPTVAAFVDPAFSIIIVGAEVYSLSFDPLKLTAGVDAANVLKITITKNGVAVEDVYAIMVDGETKLFDQADNVYTVTASLLYTETDTLTVIASNEGVSEYGTAQLEVGLPSVDRTFTEVGETTDRTLMLTKEAYTVSVTVNDAVGGPLDGYLWIGTYTGTPPLFDPLDTPINLEADGTGEFAVTAPDDAGTLVWKVGSGDDVSKAALVSEPRIDVEALRLILDWLPVAPIVDQEITFYVTNNYGDPSGNRDVKVVSPGGDLTEKVTTPEGIFKYTATEEGNYYVSVKFDATWQDPDTVTVVVTPLVSIAAAPESVDLFVDETEQLTITATYEDGPDADVTADADITYTSSADSVATVSEGLVTAVAVGDATITVTYAEGVLTETIDVPVTVSAVLVLESIASEPLSVSLNVDGTQQLTITATYTNGPDADVTADATYVSDNVTVATVSEAGVVTAVAEGEATITVTYETETTDVLVTVSLVPSVIWTCPVDHVALIAPFPAAGRPLLSTAVDLSEVTCDAEWFMVLWLDESTGEWLSFYSGFEENTLLTLEADQYYYVIVDTPCELTIPQ